MKLIYLISRVFQAWTFFIFLAQHCIFLRNFFEYFQHENQSNKTKCQHLIQHQISQYPEELREAWDHFSSHTLHETNERNKLIPPSAYERKHSSSDDEDGDFKDIPFPQDSSTTAQVRIQNFQIFSRENNFPQFVILFMDFTQFFWGENPVKKSKVLFQKTCRIGI